MPGEPRPLVGLHKGDDHGGKGVRDVGNNVGQRHLHPLGKSGEAAVAVPPHALGAATGDAVRLERRALPEGPFGLELPHDQDLVLLQAAVGEPALVAPQGAHGRRGHVLLHDVFGRCVLDPREGLREGQGGGVVDYAEEDGGV